MIIWSNSFLICRRSYLSPKERSGHCLLIFKMAKNNNNKKQVSLFEAGQGEHSKENTSLNSLCFPSPTSPRGPLQHHRHTWISSFQMWTSIGIIWYFVNIQIQHLWFGVWNSAFPTSSLVQEQLKKHWLFGVPPFAKREGNPRKVTFNIKAGAPQTQIDVLSSPSQMTQIPTGP